MAEVASIIAFASTGFKLSMTLFSFASAVGSAGRDIVQTGKDISMVSAVLRQVGLTMKRAHKGGLISDDAFQDTALIVTECKKIFANLDGLIAKATSTEKIKVIKMEEDDDEVKELDRDNLTVSYGKRLMYLFRKSEILEQKRALESLKSSLILLLQLMMFAENKMEFAEDATGSTSMDSFIADEKLGLESLVLANQAATTEYRKQKPRSTMKKDTSTTESKMASFGMVGQLSPPQKAASTPARVVSGSESGYPPPLQSNYPSQPQTNGSSAAGPGYGVFYPEPPSGFVPSPVDSAPESHDSKSPSMLSFLKSKPAPPDNAFVIVPPSLQYNREGYLAPYSSVPSPPVMPVPHSLSAPPSKTSKETTKPSLSQASKSTPSAAVDMLLNRVVTQKVQRPVKPTSTPAQTTTEIPPSAPQQTFTEAKNNPEGLPAGWEQRFDTTGIPYYIDHKTQTTTWTKPPAASKDSVPTSPAPAGHSGKASQPSENTQNQGGPFTDWYYPQSYSKPANNYHTPYVEEQKDESEEEEPIIDLFPRREARPY